MTMPCGGNKFVLEKYAGTKVTMKFPPDTTIAKVSYSYTNWDGTSLEVKETRQKDLDSKKGQKYLFEKEGQTYNTS